MLRACFQIVFLMLLTATLSICAHSQFTNPNDPRKEDIPQGIKENLAKQRIEREKKEYEKLVQRGEDALKLSQSVGKSFASNNSLSADDRKKLDQLEKLVKKIRTDLGGADENENDLNDEKETISTKNAFGLLEENAADLLEELKKSTRYTISARAIRNTNLLLKIIKFVRLNN